MNITDFLIGRKTVPSDSELQSQLDAMRASLADSQKQLTEAQSQLAGVQEELSTAQGELAAVDTENDRLEARLFGASVPTAV